MGKTIASLFSSFDKNELMQLYLYPSLPNIDVCGDYFRITDRDIINSLLKREKCGRVIEQSEVKEDNTLYESLREADEYKKIKRDSQFIRHIRDRVWQIGAWRSKDLIDWLNKGMPDVVFFASGDAVFSYKIALWIAKILDIPLITYVCDEYYFSSKQKRGCDYVLTARLRKYIKKTIKVSAHVVTICPSLGKKYEDAFGVKYTAIMTGSSFAPHLSMQQAEGKCQISYIGNLSLNRGRCLIDIANTLAEVNKDSNSSYELVYYGRENAELERTEGIRYGGFLSGGEIEATMKTSHLLLHVETMDSEYRERLRYSVSTKIADSLASGTPLFAYGPSDIASVQHLLDNDCAFVCDDKNKLSDVLCDALFNEAKRACIQQRQRIVAEEFHGSASNSEKLMITIKSVVM